MLSISLNITLLANVFILLHICDRAT